MDQPGGGDSGQPFVQSPIDTPNAPTEFRDFYNLNRTSLDFPIRGGSVSSLVNGSYTPQAAVVDAERIKKFFQSAPRGTAFIQKQTGLQLTNPRTQVPNALQYVNPLAGNQVIEGGPLGYALGNQVLPVTQTYNPANTLAQVAVQGNGAHFNRHGVNPTIYESVYQTYQYIAGNPENNTEATNRLSILRALKLIGTTDFIVNPLLVGGTGIDPTLVDRLGISTIQNQIFNYQGGPGSNYGIGFTRIFRYTDTNVTKLSQTNPDPKFTNKGILAQPYSAIAFTYQQLANQTGSFEGGRSPITTRVQDFRNQLPIGSTPRSDYARNNLITRLNIGNPGAPTARVNYNDTSDSTGVDLLNALQPFYFPAGSDPWIVKGDATNDMIKFAFECVDNSNELYFSTAALVFRAFLEGQITDSHTAEYNTFKYLGRGETFRTYQGFDRSVGFTFKIFVQSRQEMLPLYQKLNQLISQVYPDYSQTSNLMRGNVVRLTIGDYIYRTPGFLESINVSIDNSNTPWEILLKEFAEDDVRQLPHMVTVQCSFKPIMDILPRRESVSNLFVPLIANKDHYLDPGATTPAARNTLLLSNTGSIIPPVAGSGVGAQAIGDSIQPAFVPAGNQTTSTFNTVRGF
jgi:hypothetical protein